ncbi:MAG: hypothetical protein CMB80_25905 [Flammeovirgaceae bacterium]|nr:hypothetical protein [Flammeovirgaceae bacterium]MBE62179.1 hypothetical protein [Flammeovirgaceae bacterium]|tara:strand:+ start:2842 stop:3165 length:324 start_codon:yes stop_codon:yes gene_type:complete
MRKKYAIASCHEIGIKWDIEAPQGLSDDEIETVMRHVSNWTDDPDDQTTEDAFYDMDNLIEADDALSVERKELYLQIKAYPSMVHRECWVQDFRTRELFLRNSNHYL